MTGHLAFVPAPLPVPLHWDPELLRLLSDADRLVGRLAGEGRRLPNPNLLIRPFLQREAVLSSRIEGTQASLGDLLAAEAGAPPPKDPEDLKEVANYVTAMERGLRRLRTLPLSLRFVKELHADLMRGVRGETATPGEFRRSQNWIGRPGSTLTGATYVPPPPDRLMECLDPWEKFLHDESLPPLVHAALVHAQFEAIHPFLDGNGRVGRLLITLLLSARAVLPAPLLYLSAYFESERQEYYARLLATTQRSEWDEWLAYFLRGVQREAQDALDRILRVDDLIAKWRTRLAGGVSKLPERAIDLLVQNPYCTVGGLAKELGVAFTTAQRAVDRLESDSILTRASESPRNRIYVARQLLDILQRADARRETRR